MFLFMRLNIYYTSSTVPEHVCWVPLVAMTATEQESEPVESKYHSHNPRL
jgi:hypothetical protein